MYKTTFGATWSASTIFGAMIRIVIPPFYATKSDHKYRKCNDAAYDRTPIGSCPE
jgi:hypothetical protein